jgi:hypothetical protein
MTTFSNTPRLLKGALVSIAVTNPVPQVILFQYNPDTLTRSLQAQMSGEGGERSEAQRLKGAPVETIRLEVEFDATDALERAERITTTVGLYPQLSALEMLIYPSGGLVIANTALLATGVLEIIPPEAPFTLLVWGIKRVLPVRLTDFSITEEAYDINLNPIRAKVALGLRVLSYNDLPVTHPGYHLFLAHQLAKEGLAAVGSVTSVGAIVSGSSRII